MPVMWIPCILIMPISLLPSAMKKPMAMMHTGRSTTVFIGDQIFTDIYGANRTGICQYSGASDSSKRGNTDCFEAVFGKSGAVFLQKKRREDTEEMNIILIGFMGAGKTTVGKRLAEKMGVFFLRYG